MWQKNFLGDKKNKRPGRKPSLTNQRSSVALAHMMKDESALPMGAAA
jgi:hypothetical protein